MASISANPSFGQAASAPAAASAAFPAAWAEAAMTTGRSGDARRASTSSGPFPSSRS